MYRRNDVAIGFVFFFYVRIMGKKGEKKYVGEPQYLRIYLLMYACGVHYVVCYIRTRISVSFTPPKMYLKYFGTSSLRSLRYINVDLIFMMLEICTYHLFALQMQMSSALFFSLSLSLRVGALHSLLAFVYINVMLWGLFTVYNAVKHIYSRIPLDLCGSLCLIIGRLYCIYRIRTSMNNNAKCPLVIFVFR